MSTRETPDQIGDLPRIGRPANSALLGIGITTLDEVAELGREKLLALHGVGPKAIRLLDEALADQGRTLG
jgi:predicted flap endonuclease-1-like 5' DNA nuclease